MSLFADLFGSELEKKQDESFANQVIKKVAELLSRKDLNEAIVVKAVNSVLCNWAKDRENKDLVNITFDKLIEIYPNLHKKYHFQKPSEEK